MTQTRQGATLLVDSASLPAAGDAFSFAELSAQLAAAPHARIIFEGDLGGTVIAIAGIERLPRVIRGPITATISILGRPLWRGKRFHNNSGSNLWLSSRNPYVFGYFSHTTAINGHADVNYEQAQNPRLIRRITGELAKLGPGFFLGAMYLNVGNRRRVPLIYFTLEH